jgi:WD40 repeat protein
MRSSVHPRRPILGRLVVVLCLELALLGCGSEFRKECGFTIDVQVTCAVFMPDGKRIVAGCLDGIRLLDVADHSEVGRYARERQRGTTPAVNAIAISPDGKYVACAGAMMPIELRILDTGRVVRTLPVDDTEIHALCFSPNGRKLVAGTGFATEKDRRVRGSFDVWLWNLDGEVGEPVCFRGHEGPVRGVVFLPDEKRIVSVSSDRTMRMWDVSTQKELKRYGNPERVPDNFNTHRPAPSVTLSPDGKYLVQGLDLWDVDKWKRVLWHSYAPPSGLKARGVTLKKDTLKFGIGVLVPNCNWIVYVSYAGRIAVWDIDGDQQVFEEQVFCNNAPVEALAISSDSRNVLAAGAGEIPGFDALSQHVKAIDPEKIQLWRLPLVRKGE